MDDTCFFCGAVVALGEGERHDVLDTNGFGRLNALVCPECLADTGPDDEEDFNR